jgi:hypothetical protein
LVSKPHHVPRCVSRGNLPFVTSYPVAIRSMVRHHPEPSASIGD